jgi:uncharacterized protein (TIGR02147 family)
MAEKNSLFEFVDYKAYLRSRMNRMERGGRGFRSELARTVGCQTGYVTQVLNNSANFSLEQAVAINKLLGHTRQEARFFLLLIDYARAGTADLKRHFAEIIEESVQNHLNLKERFQVKQSISEIDQMAYYGEWAYVAIHVIVSIPSLQTPEAIAKAIDLPEVKVRRILEFLIGIGLVVEKNGRYSVGINRLHLGKDSPLLAKHHINWRLKALTSIDREDEESLRYTSVISIAKSDALEIKRRFVKFLEEYNSVVKDSKDESMYCLTVDFLSLIGV